MSFQSVVRRALPALFVVFLLSVGVVFGQAIAVTPAMEGSGLQSVTHEKAVLQVKFTPVACTIAKVKVEYEAAPSGKVYDANSTYANVTAETTVSNLTQIYYPHVSNLIANTVYAYRVGAICEPSVGGSYIFTTNNTFTTEPTPQAPDTPTIVSITSSVAAPWTFTVKWKQSNLSTSANTQYYFSYTAGTEYSKSVAHDVSAGSSTERTTTLDYNLEAGKSYAIFLKGCNGTSLCSPSAVTSALVGPAFTPGAGGLLGHWKFDGNGNNEVTGGQVAQLVGNAVFKSDGGKLGGYLYIPSGSDSAKIPYRSEFDLPQSFSVEFWLRQRADQSFLQDLVYKGKGTYVFPNNNYNFRIFRQLWNQYNFGPIITGYTAINTGYWTQTSNPNQLTHNEWHHVVYTKDAGKSAYYLDGQLVHSSSQTDAAVTPHDDIIIGDSAVDTDIDNLRIYNVALSADEVLNNGGFPKVTTLSGSLFANTTLEKAKSPYIVTDNVTVFPGVTLTVEPGVEVKFNQGTGLTVRGELVATGAAATPVVFTSNLAAPTKGSWSGITIDTTQGGKASLAFATVSYASAGFSVMCCHSGGPVTITDSTFRENTTALGGYAGDVKVNVDRTTFEGNYSAVTSADKKITNSTFKNNTYGLRETERISVEKSTFTGHKIALWGGRGEVKQSTITDNETGVQAFFEGFKLSYNTITNNGVGVIMGQYDTSSATVTNNNLHGNTSYNLKTTGSAAKTATSNWWGTTDTTAIEAKIHDGKDDASLGLVTYVPVLSAAVDIVTMIAPAPVPTPTPSPTPTTPAPSPTVSTLSGGLYSNLNLEKAKSPYTVTDNVTVFPGVKLTVEPGVEIKFNQGKGLTVRGELVATGAAATPIVFTSNLAAPTKGSWNGIAIDTTQGGKASLSFATVSYASTGFSVMCCHSGGPVTIADSTFRENATALGGYAGSVMVTIDRTTFENNTNAVTQADKKITNSTFKNNTYGLYQTERISVEKSTFTGHKVALWGGRGTVTQSTITGNETGVQAFFEGFTLKHNTITGNGVGVILGQYDSTSPSVTSNNIHGNTSYDLKVTGNAAKTATSNWWGTTDTAAIDTKIHDGKDDAALGLVTYQPIATAAIDITNIAVSSPITTPKQCADSKDNDNDGLIDYPKDPGCYGTDDDDEFNQPVTVVPKIISLEPQSAVVGTKVVITGSGFVSKNSLNFGSGYLTDLSSSDSGTKVSFTVPSYLEPACVYATPRCATPALPTTPGVYQVAVVNTLGTSNGVTFTVLKTEPVSTPKQCADGKDNDNDGLIDYPKDPSCSSLDDDDEMYPTTSPEPSPTPTPTPIVKQCADGKDNDNDGLIDYPKDSGCYGLDDDVETDPAPQTGTGACPAILEEVCGEYRGQPVTYGNACELNRASAAYRYSGKCQKVPEVVQKICPQVYEPVCGKDGHTYPNRCAADGVTEVAWEGSCEKPKQDVGIAPSPVDVEREEKLRRAHGLLEALSNRMAHLARFLETLVAPEAQETVRALVTGAEVNYRELKAVFIAKDVAQLAALQVRIEEFLRESEKKLANVKQAYTKDLIREESARSRELVERYTTTATGGQDVGFFGDDPTYLRAKIEKKQAILQRAEQALARGEKKLAQRLYGEAEEVLGGRTYVYTTPANAQFAETSDLTRLLEEVRNGLTAVWEGIDRLKREGVESNATLLATLQKAETVFEEASKALTAGNKEEVARLFDTLKQLGLSEKFGHFRAGTGRTVLPKERVIVFIREIKAKREHLERGSEELARRGSDTKALEPLRTRLTTLLAKAESAFEGGDEKLLVQLLDELRSMDIEAVLSQLFRNLGERDFVDEIKEPLAKAPEYIVAMTKVIDELRAKKADVALYEKFLAATEAARVRGQAALDQNDTKTARDAVHAMFESGMRLYELLGARDVERAFSKKERQLVTQTFEVNPASLANVSVLGTNAENTIANIITKTGGDATDRFVITETLSQMPADVVEKLITANTRQKKAVQALMANMVDLPPEVRAAMFENKVALLDGLASVEEARRAASKVKGISRAALEQIDALRAKLADFNFPPETGAFIVKRVETFADTVRSGELTDPQEFAAYVGTFQKEIATFFTKATEEKYARGIIPAKNIDERSAVYAPALTLKQEGALDVLLTKKGEVQLANVIDGRTYEKLLETAVDENAFTGKEAQALKRAKNVRGIDAVRYLFVAYDVSVPRATLVNPARLAAFIAREFDVRFTPQELARPLTRAQAITLVGTVHDAVSALVQEE